MIRKSRKIVGVLATLVLVLALAFVGAGVATSADESVDVALSENGGSGITATLTFTGQSVTGTASGLDPDRRYISLTYGAFSTAQPGALLTCADPQTAASPREWGITPEWTVNADGTGTIDGMLGRPFDGAVYTVSIRQVPNAAIGDDPYTLFDPVRYPVVACGDISADDRELPLPAVPNPLPLLPVQLNF